VRRGSVLRRTTFFALFLLMLFFCRPSLLWAGQEVVVGVYEDPPLVFTDENGRWTGIYPDFLEAVAAENDWSIRYVPGTFVEGLKRLEEGKIDIMTSIAWSEERQRLFDFTNHTVLSNWGVVYTRSSLPITSIFDLMGRVVAVERGDIYGQKFRRLAADFGIDCEFLETGSVEDVFRALSTGQADAGVVNRVFAAMNEDRYDVHLTNFVFSPVDLRFAVSKGKNRVIIQVLDFHLAEMSRNPDSVLHRSIAKWVGGDNMIETTPKHFIWGGVFLLLLVLGLALAWFRLQRQVWHRSRELLKSKQDLIREKAFLEKLFEEIPDAVVLEDPYSSIIQRINAGFTRVFGFTSEEAVGKTLNDLVVPPDRQEEGRQYDAKGAMGEKLFAETVRQKKDGSPVDVIMSAVPVYVGKNLSAIYTIYRDVTKLKNVEKDLLVSRNAARESYRRMENTWEQTVTVLSAVAESKDPYTAGHQRRVAELAVAIARELMFREEKVKAIELAARLHDIGKINIPTEILSKPGILSDLEMDIIRTHPQTGYEILKEIDLPWNLAEIVLQHHEHLDGSGYPRGLKGGDILYEARIITVADVVEAMSSHRPYRPALGIEKALAEIESYSGTWYDPAAVRACLALFREKHFAFSDS
jgi:PAS domain S-box-containing protein/putative nucleotidyltransferase with HDIG domain